MELSNHFEAIVENLVDQIYKQVQERAQENISGFLEHKISEFDLESKVSEIIQQQAAARVNAYEFDTRQLSSALAETGKKAVAELSLDIHKQVSDLVSEQFANTDFKTYVREQINEIVEQRILSATYPEASIPHSAINFANIQLTGDDVVGGIIKNFGSTGIDDRATECRVTVLDSHLIVESPIVTTGVDVRGNVSVGGKLVLTGGVDVESAGYLTLLADTTTAVRSSLNEELFLEYSNIIAENIHERGIDFKEVLINGKLVLSETKLGPSVTHSNLRRVGELDELQVRGEVFLSQTLYSSQRRVGINTIEPTAALTVWDEDIEILVGKKSQGRGFIGTNRQMAITLGANNKENLSLDVDGSVTINDLRLGALPLSTASVEPNWEGRAGEIVFNDCPAIGKPIGWVCLEGHRWGHFGIIQG